jgi:hypothetical protein
MNVNFLFTQLNCHVIFWIGGNVADTISLYIFSHTLNTHGLGGEALV